MAGHVVALGGGGFLAGDPSSPLDDVVLALAGREELWSRTREKLRGVVWGRDELIPYVLRMHRSASVSDGARALPRGRALSRVTPCRRRVRVRVRAQAAWAYALPVPWGRRIAMPLAGLLGLLTGALGAGTLGGEPAAAAGPKAITVRVDARDFRFTLSRRSVPAGVPVAFVVRNRGATPHDFVIAGRRTRILQPGASATLKTTFTRKGPKAFLCSVAGHARLGMRGGLGVATPAPPATAPPAPVVVADTAVLTEVGRFTSPVHVTAPVGESRRLFVTEQAGVVRILEDGKGLETPFLDIRDRVLATSSEPGLLSIAFPPDYAQSRTTYALYNARKGNGDIRISAFTLERSGDARLDPASERILLEIRKPWENHNGGLLQFGPDGMLYASVGDGDSGVLNRPGAFAQTRDDLLGNILRIDPRGTPYAVPLDNPFVGQPGLRPEIWAYGLRNPWRFWIDAPTGRMLIGDVGLGTREEIDVVPAGAAGRNFGWPCFEGSVPFDPTATCVDPVPPIWESDRSDGGCSVIAGVVARDPRIPALVGRFLYGDFCTGRIQALAVPADTVIADDDLGLRVPRLSSFGTDGVGRIHLASHDGQVFRLDPAG